jgi:DNA-binding response OmpR family regulator
MSASILIVEDDDAIAAGLTRSLEGQGYAVRRLALGLPAAAAVEAGVDLVVLDLGLPDVDGLEICRRLRAAHPRLPILILTARDTEMDVVAGLDAGADDYLVKPVRLSELLARVRVQVRRGSLEAEPPGVETRHVAGTLVVEPEARRAWRDGDELELRRKEFDLLHLLVAEAGRVLTRERIMREVWETEWLGATKTLDTHILTLRGKLGEPPLITTLRGIGYRLDADLPGG